MEFSDYKNLREALKEEWGFLWRTLIEDKLRAEGIASQNFPLLFTDRGDVVFATRDYKPLSFGEVLERHIPREVADRINPHPSVGGIRKFIREMLTKNRTERRRDPHLEDKPKKHQGPRKNGGRGWLHTDLGIRKKFRK